MNSRFGLCLATTISLAVGLAALGATEDAGGPSLQAVRTGSAVLQGVVVTDSTQPEPLRRATVRITTDGMSPRLAGTDDDGRFRFDALPAGSYTVSATKPGYVTAYHGATRAGEGPGIPVAVADGGRTDITLALLKGAVLTGIVTGSFETPAAGVPVVAVDVRSTGGTSPPRALTDDRGVYRIFGLAPGDYVVSAIPALTESGRGRVRGNVIAVTDAEARWARAAAAAGSGSPLPAQASFPPAPGRPVAYAPVFYPGTVDATAATRVSVSAGEERRGIDLTLRLVAMARISGTMVDEQGQRLNTAVVTLTPRTGDQPSAVEALIASRALVLPSAGVSNGTFTITGVAPGEYTMVARTGGGQRGARPAATTPPGAPTLWSVTDLVVDGNDRADVALVLTPGLSLAGSVTFEANQPPLAPSPAGIDVMLVPTARLAGVSSSPVTLVNQDGTFRFPSVAPGAYLLRATLPATAGARWVLKSAIVNGRDLADLPLDARAGGTVEGLVVTFTERAAAVSGRLLDAGGRPVTRYTVVVCPADRAMWVPGARRVRSTRPATDGSFSVAGLPAGEYAMAAVEDFRDAFLDDPAFLERLLASAYRFTLATGEERVQDLRAGR